MSLTLGTMAVANVLSHRVLPGADAAIGFGLVGGLAIVARASELNLADLGLARRSWLSGLRWGGVAAAVVAAGYGVAALIPGALGAVDAGATSWPDALFKALVVI